MSSLALEWLKAAYSDIIVMDSIVDKDVSDGGNQNT